MVTLSVLKKNKVGVPTPVPAKLTIYATNLTQQLSNITMREIKEGTAIYYIGEFRVVPPDTLKFTATVEVAGEPQARNELRSKVLQVSQTQNSPGFGAVFCLLWGQAGFQVVENAE